MIDDEPENSKEPQHAIWELANATWDLQLQGNLQHASKGPTHQLGTVKCVGHRHMQRELLNAFGNCSCFGSRRMSWATVKCTQPTGKSSGNLQLPGAATCPGNRQMHKLVCKHIGRISNCSRACNWIGIN